MTPPREWLKPPRTLLVSLALLTLASVSALAWFAWRLQAQERMVEAQRARERLEQAADRITATLRESLAETGERLRAWLASGPTGGEAPAEGVLLLLTDSELSATPANRLLYYPIPSAEPEARAEVFSEAEALEFSLDRPGDAAQSYRRLAEASNGAIRAGALLRLGRVLRNEGLVEESRAAYARLAAITGAKVAGVPADLVGRAVSAELSGRPAGAEALRNDLLKGRWRLTRGQFEFYWSLAGGMAGRAEPFPAGAAALSEAAAAAWSERTRDASARGQETLWIGGQPFFVAWRGVPGRRAALVARPASMLKEIFAGEKVLCAIADAEGRILAGARSGAGDAAVRTAAESQLPWTLYVTETKAAADNGLRAHQRFLALGVSMMALFLALGSFFIARAIRKELEVSRMQSDFVSTVSHEFRSPLTSIRQLSEILALGRAPSEERRQVYYETLVRETARLQRLVEALLNFGRMEAGARQYRFEVLDVAALAHRVVAEFEPRAAASGRSFELDGPHSEVRLEADPEAIAVALRNLVDNALKYAPDSPTVWVEWGTRNGAVSIRVRDRGPGVADAEKKAIFRKFVRGSAAAASNVKGSGVGLAMVKHIVAAHGGEISVTSAPGKGSVFTMLLPAARKQ